MLAMPVVLGGALFLSGRSTYALVFVVGWPVIMLVTWLTTRRQQRKEFERELAAWREDMQAVLDQLDHAASVQREHAEDDDPDVDVVRSRVVSRDRRLWVRGPDDDDFGLVRVGRGGVPAKVTGKRSSSGDREVLLEARELLSSRAVLEQMPVTVPVLEHGVVAVTGDPDELDAAVRAMVLRLAGGHSPAEVQLVALLGRGREHLESWLRWLPHCAPRSGGVAPVAVGPVEATPLLEVLAAEGAGRGRTVCLVDAGCGLPRRVVEAAAAAGPEQGLHLIWFGTAADEIPSRTAVHVDLRAKRVEQAGRRGRVDLDSTDAVGLVPAWHAARGMTGYQDAVALVQPDSALPEQVRLPDLGTDLRSCDDVDTVLGRWTAARGLRAQIGSGVDGVVTLDLREDGPHGLVAGTTGSGKSELLQTLISSLAVNNPPTRITFLLVDYKGGAAFRECADLPHTVGYITDLTPALVQRALVSLHAELTHREGLLAEHGAKDLVALERDHPEVAPPSLLICVDEFAALTAEVPDFVDGMVVHRPAGPLARDAHAAGHAAPGRRRHAPDQGEHRPAHRPAGGVRRRQHRRHRRPRRRPALPPHARTGLGAAHRPRHHRARPGGVGRRARAPARRRRHRAGRAVLGARPRRRRPGGRRARAPALGPRPPGRDDHAPPSSGRGLPEPRRPWLPALGPGPAAAPARTSRRSRPAAPGCRWGSWTGRSSRASRRYVVDYARVGHLLVYGTSGSGKTELLRTLAAAATTPSSAPSTSDGAASPPRSSTGSTAGEAVWSTSRRSRASGRWSSRRSSSG